MMRNNGRTALLLTLCLVTTVVGSFVDQFAEILESKSFDDGQGNYEFRVRTSDGNNRWQTGRLQYSGDKPYIHVEGGYSYYDHSLGVKRIVTFVADQNGYRPTFSQEPITTPLPPAYPSRFGAGAAGGG